MDGEGRGWGEAGEVGVHAAYPLQTHDPKVHGHKHLPCTCSGVAWVQAGPACTSHPTYYTVPHAPIRLQVSSKEAFEERSALREKLDRAYDKLKARRAEEAAIAGDIQVGCRVREAGRDLNQPTGALELRLLILILGLMDCM